MTDQELADKVVALGIGSERKGHYSHLGSGFLSEKQGLPLWFGRTSQTADCFVRDWRVAGALLEKTASGSWVLADDTDLGKWSVLASATGETYGQRMNESFPRAIIEACVEALGND